MKPQRIHMPGLSYLAAFVIGVILFAVFWKGLFGAASSLVVLVGMIEVALMVTIFWFWNESQSHGRRGR